jgi:hypothetical protein
MAALLSKEAPLALLVHACRALLPTSRQMTHII